MQLAPDTARRVSSALLRLRLRAPFMATLALFARIEATVELPTAATDGRDVFLNEDFFGRLLSSEQDGLLLHEILHAALLHVPRRGGRDPHLWNVAADIVVNGMIAAEGVLLPEGGLRDRRLERFSVEEVYDLLLHETTHTAAPWADLLDAPPGETRPAPTRPALEAHWRNAHQQARVVALSHGHGDAPAGMLRDMAALAPARLDWRAILWRFVARTPVDFGDFDRRFVGRGLYLETLTGESAHVIIAVDTSGSVSDQQMAACLSEVTGIVATYPHLRCTLYYADAALHGPYELSVHAPPPQPQGGGGTDFRPFFRRTAEEFDTSSAAVLVYLTDGEGEFPVLAPPLPVLWVVTPGGRDLDAFPFGDATRLLLGE